MEVWSVDRSEHKIGYCQRCSSVSFTGNKHKYKTEGRTMVIEALRHKLIMSRSKTEQKFIQLNIITYRYSHLDHKLVCERVVNCLNLDHY